MPKTGPGGNVLFRAPAQLVNSNLFLDSFCLASLFFYHLLLICFINPNIILSSDHQDRTDVLLSVLLNSIQKPVNPEPLKMHLAY